MRKLRRFRFSLPKVPPLLAQLSIIAFFIGLNSVLGATFLKENKLRLPPAVARVLLQFGIVPGEKLDVALLTNPYSTAEITLDADAVLTEINEERSRNNLDPFTSNQKLASAAARLLEELEQAEFDVESESFGEQLKPALDEVGYKYAWIHHNALVGPLTPKAALTAWLSDTDQTDSLLNQDLSEIGLATKVVDTKFMGKAGIIVQLLAEPQSTVTNAQSGQQVLGKSGGTAGKPLSEFSDYAVFTALNEYRQAHRAHALVENEHLCTYAEKRVQDLIAYGSLDGHKGFMEDFSKPEKPVGIRDYPGGRVGENLASQYCVNGTTGQPMYVENPTQLIEWCFDSSQRGHREAQLDTAYNNVCVRHGKNMYVVIFGE